MRFAATSDPRGLEQAYATVVAEENPDGLPTADSDAEDFEEVQMPSATADAAAAAAESSDDDIEIIEDSGYQEEISMVSVLPRDA